MQQDSPRTLPQTPKGQGENYHFGGGRRRGRHRAALFELAWQAGLPHNWKFRWNVGPASPQNGRCEGRCASPPPPNQTIARNGSINPLICPWDFGRPGARVRAPGAQMIRVGAGSSPAFQRLSRDISFFIISAWLAGTGFRHVDSKI
eukprot:gene8353-biopygen4626